MNDAKNEELLSKSLRIQERIFFPYCLDNHIVPKAALLSMIAGYKIFMSLIKMTEQPIISCSRCRFNAYNIFQEIKTGKFTSACFIKFNCYVLS